LTENCHSTKQKEFFTNSWNQTTTIVVLVESHFHWRTKQPAGSHVDISTPRQSILRTTTGCK